MEDVNSKIVSSRRQYKSFIKSNGLFPFKRNKNADGCHKENRSLLAIILRLLKEFKQQRFRLILVIVIGFLVNITSAAFPWAGKYMIDTILPQKSTIFLLVACVILMVVDIVDVILNYFRDYTANAISGTFSVAIKNRMMRHLQKLPLIRIQELKVGGIISRLQQDTDAMSGLLFEAIVSPFNAIVMLAIAFSSLLLINWKVSLLCMLFSLCIGAIGYFVFNIILPFQKILREDNSRISGLLTEVFNGITVVRSFCKEKTINREYGYGIGLLWRKTLYGNIISISVNRAIWFIYYLMQASIWLLGGYSVIKGNMTIGDIVVFISFIPYYF